MSIILNWSARGQTADNIKIYRSTVRDAAGFSLLVTLPGDAITYEDTTALINKLYYYRVNIVIGAEEVPGMITPNMICPDTGPGPKTLVKGTMEWGYFGKLTAGEFLSSSQLRTTYGGMSNWGTASLNDISYWRKYACNGTIIYIPDSCLYLSASAQLLGPLNALYAAGILYGNNNAQKVPFITSGARVQNAKVVKDQYEFMIRAPKVSATSDGSAGYLPVTTGTFEWGLSEAWLITMCNAARYVNVIYIGNNTSFPAVSPVETTLPAYDVITQHMSSSTLVYIAPMASGGFPSAAAVTTNRIWGYLPILELILG